MTLFVGVDAGASHTEAAVSDDRMKVFTRRRGRPGFTAPGRQRRAAAVIMRAVRAALRLHGGRYRRPGAIVVGAAGAAAPAERLALKRELDGYGLCRHIHVVTDAEIALESAFPHHAGVLVIAGTGSIALARTQHGRFHRVGGHGPLFGDEGSGYAIASSALRAAFQAHERRGPETLLLDLLETEVGGTTGEQLIQWTRYAQRDRVASLAPIVMLAAQSGDAVARRILSNAANELVNHVEALAVHARVGRRRIRVATSGGLLGHDTPLRRRFEARLRRRFRSVVVERRQVDPSLGALRLARRSYLAGRLPAAYR